MATKTHMSKDGSVSRRGKKKMPSSHLSALMMLSSQLMSTGRFNEGLPGFITRGLDAEQIWQQLELRNDHKLSLPACSREIVRIQSSESRAKRKKNEKKMKQVTAGDDTIEDTHNLSDSDNEEKVLESIKKRLAQQPNVMKSSDGFSDSEVSEEDGLDFDFEMDKEISKGLSDEDDLEDITIPQLKKKDKKGADQGPKRTSIVDDRFFKLADMEQFLDSEDLKEEKNRKREEKKGNMEDESEDDDEEEEIDMFGDLEGDDDDNAMATAKYSDFFDPPGDETAEPKAKKKLGSDMEDKEEESMSEENENESDSEQEEYEKADSDVEEVDEKADSDMEEEEDTKDDADDEDGILKSDQDIEPKKAVSFENDLFNDSEDEGIDGQKESASSIERKSTFEKKQEQLQAKAREMEELSLREAPWELTGETTASKRPENSLLETHLDFQHTTRAAPIITDETTKTLEDYIKQRIKDKAFDDVERKEKPKEDPFEFKKRIVLDQEKSKMSLGELYEQEFLKQQQQDKEEVKADPECEKIEADLKKLFGQLDALCNFRYTPMKAGTEVKIIVNTPAITMEEVAPTATTDAQLLAPEEVREKIKGDLKANDERDSTDKKRERRNKKKEKREKKKAKEAREKVVEKLNPGLGNKYSKAKAIRQLEQISKTDKSVTLIKGDQKKLSSTKFFNELQEEVQTNVRSKKAAKEKKKKNVVDASKVML